MILLIFSIQKGLKNARIKTEKVLAYAYHLRVLTNFQRAIWVFDSVKNPSCKREPSILSHFLMSKQGF
jgi:hypothetical protein